MKTNIYKTIVSALLITVAGILGYFLGASQGQESPGNLAALTTEGSASTLKAHVKLLEKLKSHQSEEAIETLENLVDIDLISLAAYSDMQQFTPSPTVAESLRLAKNYREKFQRHQGDPEIEHSINKAFALVE